jgi:hypothetical protein
VPTYGLEAEIEEAGSILQVELLAQRTHDPVELGAVAAQGSQQEEVPEFGAALVLGIVRFELEDAATDDGLLLVIEHAESGLAPFQLEQREQSAEVEQGGQLRPQLAFGQILGKAQLVLGSAVGLEETAFGIEPAQGGFSSAEVALDGLRAVAFVSALACGSNTPIKAVEIKPPEGSRCVDSEREALRECLLPG